MIFINPDSPSAAIYSMFSKDVTDDEPISGKLESLSGTSHQCLNIYAKQDETSVACRKQRSRRDM